MSGSGVARRLGRIAALPARAAAHALAWPVRAVAVVREPAVAQPWLLAPGDRPPTGDRLLLLFDGGCGICLHARDVFVLLDRRGRLATDRIARHDMGLLRNVDTAARYESWHVYLPSGERLDGADGLIAVIGALPGGGPLAALLRRMPGTADAGYRWFARNRSWISQGSGLIDHPQRDPTEQLTHPDHTATLARLAREDR